MERMFKYGIFNSDKCQRCGEKETYTHLMRVCIEARRIQKGYNDRLCKIGYSQAFINMFYDIFITCDNGGLSIVNMKVIKDMIQMEQPVSWSIDNVEKLQEKSKVQNCIILKS